LIGTLFYTYFHNFSIAALVYPSLWLTQKPDFAINKAMKRLTVLVFMLVSVLFFLFPENQDKWNDEFDKYSAIFSILKQHYYDGFETEKIVFDSINGFLRFLDPHSYFLDPLTLRTMGEDQRGNYYGIGIRIIKYEDRITILSLLKDTPGYHSGILPGDVIIEIDGMSTRLMTLDQAVKKLRGTRSTQVNIKVIRKGVASPILFKIKRAKIPLDSISYSIPHPLKPQIGYISIRTFGHTTPREFENKFQNMINQHKIQALIIDLRGNSGGLLQAAIEISDFFLEKGKTIVSIKTRNSKQSYQAQKNNQYEGFPLAILINRQSASASEIVASALKDHNRATLIGSRSWGKGLVETVYQLPLDCALALTTAKYYTPSNRLIQRDYSDYNGYFSIPQEESYDDDRDIRGGVFPDILVKDAVYPPLVIEFISKGIFFGFTRELVGSQFSITKNFVADERIIQRFKRFLQEKNIGYKIEEFDANLKMIKYEIERDALSNQLSSAEGIKAFLKRDPVTEKAVEILGKLIENRSLNATRK
jgi:carboxyl-terminal processing protease